MVKRIILGIIFLLLVVAVLGEFSLTTSKTDFKISFLEVGQGDAVLVQFKEGQNVLIDGGPDKRIIKALDQELPFGDRVIDLIILTHPHSDHVRGLNSVIRRFEVKEIILPPTDSTLPALLDLIDFSKQADTTITEVVAPFQVEISDKCSFDFFHPLEEDLELPNLNNLSLVTKLDCQDLSFLFTGDIEIKAENLILDRGFDLESDVLKVAHHGSKSSSQIEFLQAVSPELAIVSVGQDNRFGHPSLRTIRKLERLDSIVLRTDWHGTINLEIQEGAWRVVTSRN